MNITISLSEASVQNAIRKLEKAKENLANDLKETVSILAKEGASIANGINGSMASATDVLEDMDEKVPSATAVIHDGGKVPLIAEFGAGNATMNGWELRNADLSSYWPEADSALNSIVFPGSYSLFVGSGDYWRAHMWRFGWTWYKEVQPRQGMFLAKEWIKNNSSRIAGEVIKL